MMSKQVRVTSPDHPDCVAVEFLWDEDYPMDFGLSFIHEGGEEVTWILGREFLIEAVDAEKVHGEGDVKAYVTSRGQFILELMADQPESAIVFIPRQPLKSFLETTLKVVSLEDEDYGSIVDEILEDILG